MHALKKRFEDESPAFGLWMCLPGAQIARVVARASDLDCIILDCEHGLVALQGGAHETVSAIRQSAEQHIPSVLVRIPAVDDASRTWQIKVALDTGAQGIIVPMVDTAESARNIARWSRFPPMGSRGFGSPFAHENWGEEVSRLSYVQAANAQVTVGIQIETALGLKNAAEIAQVEGIDLIFIGPVDLAMSLGAPRPFPVPDPSFEAKVQEIKRLAHNAGKKVGIVALSGPAAQQRAAEGFDLVTLGSDTSMIAQKLSEQLALSRSTSA